MKLATIFSEELRVLPNPTIKNTKLDAEWDKKKLNMIAYAIFYERKRKKPEDGRVCYQHVNSLSALKSPSSALPSEINTGGD